METLMYKPNHFSVVEYFRTFFKVHNYAREIKK